MAGVIKDASVTGGKVVKVPANGSNRKATAASGVELSILIVPTNWATPGKNCWPEVNPAKWFPGPIDCVVVAADTPEVFNKDKLTVAAAVPGLA
jgi:hypothetical protein